MANQDAAQGCGTTQAGEGFAAEPCLESTATGRYANYFKVGYNSLEVVLEFGESFSDGAQARVHTRIVTHPVYARAFLALLDDAVLARDQAPDDIANASARDSRGGA